MEAYSFPRYLSAKRSVDDRALNARVWAALRDELGNNLSPQVLEIGAGTGTMLHRLVEQGVLRGGSYLGVDASAENIACARVGITAPGWDAALAAEFLCADVFACLPHWEREARFDLLVANAFLDLVDIPALLPRLRAVLRPGGLALFTINFDGVTIFEPPVEPVLDEKILALYHRSMDARLINGAPSGDSRSGRRLFHLLPAGGFEIIAAGGSDWVVYPQAGAYPHDEAYFLRHILYFFEESLSSHPELAPGELETWLACRREQIERGELVYIAHQMDFLARRPPE